MAALTAGIDQLVASVRTAAVEGQPAHHVEPTIWNHLLKLGRALLDGYFRAQGTGDVGPQVTRPDGSTADRLEHTHTRKYRSAFGDLILERTVYGSREGQAITFVPLDNRVEIVTMLIQAGADVHVKDDRLHENTVGFALREYKNELEPAA